MIVTHLYLHAPNSVTYPTFVYALHYVGFALPPILRLVDRLAVSSETVLYLLQSVLLELCI